MMYVPQARVLATIGVTRGLGDHDLKVHDSNIYIKPFLSCCPEVRATITPNCLLAQALAPVARSEENKGMCGVSLKG